MGSGIKWIPVIFLWAISYVCVAEPVYTVGVVPQFNARQIFRIWTPILSELEHRTGLKFKLIGTSKIPEFEKQFLNGEFDFAYMNPYFMLLGHNEQGYQPLVRDVRRSLYGILVVRKDSNIKSVKDLDGKEIAFPAPNAVGASLVTRADMKNIFNINFFPRYVKTHSSVYLNVYKGLVPAGGGVQKSLQKQPKSIRDKLKVIYKTRRFAPHPFAAHPRVNIEHQERVKKALLELGKTEHGKKLLHEIPIEEIGEANMKSYILMKSWGLDRFFVEE